MKIMKNFCIMKNIGGRWTLNRDLDSSGLKEGFLWSLFENTRISLFLIFRNIFFNIDLLDYSSTTLE